MTKNASVALPLSTSRWPLKDAKARFSELVRRAQGEGPQHVTVHGRDEVVVVAAAEYDRLRGQRSGQALIDAMQACPVPDFEIERLSIPMPVRDVEL